jgi:hypothetical protein
VNAIGIFFALLILTIVLVAFGVQKIKQVEAAPSSDYSSLH